MPVTATTAATASGIQPIGDNHNRKSFYGVERHWLFYSNGTQICFRSSIGGSVWTAETVIRAGSDAGGFSVVYDGNSYVHYTFAAGQHVFYRRGELSSNGTITWNAEVQAHTVPGGDGTSDPEIVLDSDGYPWIGYRWQSALGGWLRPYVTKSTTKDGTWTTAAGFPYEMSAAIDGASCIAVPVPLTSLKMYVLYSKASETIRGKLYDAGWGAEETVSTSNINVRRLSAVSEDDDVHMVFTRTVTGGTYPLKYVKRTYGATPAWGSEEEIVAPTYIPLGEVTVDSETSHAYVFWTSEGIIKLRRNVNGSWDNTIEWITGEGSLPEQGGEAARVKAFRDKTERLVGVAWVRGTAAPYDVRYDTMILLPTPLKTTLNSGL